MFLELAEVCFVLLVFGSRTLSYSVLRLPELMSYSVCINPFLRV